MTLCRSTWMRRRLRRAVSLVEALAAIPIVGLVLVAAINSVGTSRIAAQSLAQHRDASRFAESLLNEIVALLYEDDADKSGSPGPSAAELATGNRSLFNDVNDYDGWKASPPQQKNGLPIAGAARYRERVELVLLDPATLLPTGGPDLGLMRVTVSLLLDVDPVVTLTAFRTRGLPVLEACCMPDRTCRNLPTGDCTAQNGRVAGIDTQCATIDCSGAVAHWRLDEGAGTLADDSAGPHDATLFGPAWVVGRLGQALSFTGDYANVLHRDALALSNELTLTAWIWKTSVMGYDTIIFKGRSGSINYYLDTYANRLLFGFYLGGWREFLSPTPSLLRNRWYHVAVTYNAVGRTVSMYVDGASAGTSTLGPEVVVPLPVDTANLTIGKSYLGEYFDGAIDDVRIYDFVLTPTEIITVRDGGDPAPRGPTEE